jgi:hypothetical protein
MPDQTLVMVNGRPITVPAGSTVVVALLLAQSPCRISVAGQPRTALCGMGICFECRASVDGVPHTRTCQMVCTHGMVVETQL